MDSDIDYTDLQGGNNEWVAQQSATKDGRFWYINDDAPESMKYMYYTTRGEGWIISGSHPDLGQDDPWTTNNNQVRLEYDLEGAHDDTRLYCGHDDGAPANGCHKHPRGHDNLYYLWCDNDGQTSVSCLDEPNDVSGPLCMVQGYQYEARRKDDDKNESNDIVWIVIVCILLGVAHITAVACLYKTKKYFHPGTVVADYSDTPQPIRGDFSPHSVANSYPSAVLVATAPPAGVQMFTTAQVVTSPSSNSSIRNKHCGNCGASLNAGNKFCVNCGAQIEVC